MDTPTGPWVFKMGNARSFKHAVLEPKHPKPSLDPDLVNVRPIFKVPFVSKTFKKVAAEQLTSFSETHGGLHSTEAAL